MIYELLSEGAENAKTGRELSQQLGCNIRIITEKVARERREGQPICAAANGYYLAADVGELEAYCNRLKGQGIELFKTRQPLINTLKQMKNNEE